MLEASKYPAIPPALWLYPVSWPKFIQFLISIASLLVALQAIIPPRQHYEVGANPFIVPLLVQSVIVTLFTLSILPIIPPAQFADIDTLL